MWAFIRRFKRNQSIVKEIYLLSNGSVTEIHFANQLKRRLFGEPLSKLYYNSIFVSPDIEKEQILIINKDDLFPKEKQRQKSSTGGYAWIKYFANG